MFTERGIFADTVNIPRSVNGILPMTRIGSGRPRPSWLLRLLRSLDEIQAEPTLESADVDIRVLGGQLVRFSVIAEPLVSGERASAIVEQLRGSATAHPLLATKRLSARSRTILREAGVSWIERETGYCRLVAPGLLVETTIRSPSGDLAESDARHPRGKGPPALLRGRSGLLAETVLARAPGEVLRLRAIADAAGLSAALVSRLFDRLTRLGILAARGRGPNKRWALHDPGALLDRWGKEEREAPEEITGISIWSRTPAEIMHRVATTLNEHEIRYAFGGVTAANLHRPTLTVAPTPELWIPADLSARDVARRLGGEVVASGASIRIWQTRGDTALHHATQHSTADRDVLAPLSVVTPYRAYVEAHRAPGRGADVAEALRRTFDLVSRAPAIETDPDA